MKENIEPTSKKERHILALSGGKDSAALAVYMRERHPEIELEYVFTDSGCELPETYEYLDRIRAVLNINITVISSEKGWDNYWKLAKVKHTKYGSHTYLPSPKNRWCTELLKLKPYDSWLERNYPGEIIHSYVGLRADEKRERKGFIAPKTKMVPHFPFIEDGLIYEDIKKLLLESGLGFPDYYEWRNRSGCYFCFYQTKKEWLGLYEHHPELYRKAMSFETIIPEKGIKFTWCDDVSLEELITAQHHLNIRKNPENNSGKVAIKLIDLLSDIV